MKTTSTETKWQIIPEKQTINKAIKSLIANNIEAFLVSSEKKAREKVLNLIPEGTEVMTMSSVTLDKLGISDVIQKSGKYNSVKTKLLAMDRNTQGLKMLKLGSAPEYAIGSVHAVTEDGKVVIASNSGSQLPAYAYGAEHVIWVVGAQKIVKNLDEAFERIYNYTLKKEGERINKVFGTDKGSFVSKLLIFNRELSTGRIKMVIVKKNIGF